MGGLARITAAFVEMLGSRVELAQSLTFAAFTTERVPACASVGEATMNASVSFLADVDHLCGQFATALHNAEWQVYAALTLLIVLSALLFPFKDDPDQI
jgi:hypothetical protein